MIGNAVLIARIATGEVEDTVPDDGKDKAAQALGRKAGCASEVYDTEGAETVFARWALARLSSIVSGISPSGDMSAVCARNLVRHEANHQRHIIGLGDVDKRLTLGVCLRDLAEKSRSASSRSYRRTSLREAKF